MKRDIKTILLNFATIHLKRNLNKIEDSMDLLNDWLETYKEVLTSPSGFFESEGRRDGFGFPLKFALINLIISGILSAASTFAFAAAAAGLGATGILGSSLAAAAFSMTLGPILGVLGLLLMSGVVHIFVALLGGENGYRETLSVAEYATVIYPITGLLSFIPLIGSILNLLVALYGLFIEIKGLENFQEMSTGSAAAAIIIPVAILAVIGFYIAFVVLPGSLALNGA